MEVQKLTWEGDFEDHFHPSWHRHIQSYIESEEMFNIYKELKKCRDIVVPASRDTFRSFSYNYDDIKCVLILSDPYPWIKNGRIISDGIPMSCSSTGLLQPSLEQFYTGMSNELGQEVQREPDLSYLLEQGVFLINTALTVKLNKVGSHQDLWIPFMKYLFEEVFYTSTGMIYWMMGKEAKRVEKWINPLGNYLLYSTHPAAAAHKNTIWSSEGNFKRINNILRGNKREDVWWDKKEFKLIQELPF